ncbi:Glucoamylase GLU1 precursor [Scheffersomyces xylosifermentans]|uniref:Glucoamylase GLU1 precursor n=1 Tax=Scheffersomyces xylosifermentans TaxID=1304137 RepID=UPI00315C9039
MKLHILLLLQFTAFVSSLYIPVVKSSHKDEIALAFNSNVGTFPSDLSFFHGLIQQFFRLGATVKEEDNIRLADFETWVVEQKKVSFQGILNNIGGVSEFLNVSEVSKGAVIASPSKNKPNYFYQWVRDAALTIKSLIYHIDDNKFENVDDIKSVIEAYIENNYYLQRLDNNSGKFDDQDKAGLGEPKFNANNTAFTDNWGRPQRDGPGLRAITVLSYLSLLEKWDKKVSNEFLQSPEFIYNEIVKPDLIYIIKNWFKEGFDLWEEVNSHHYYTSITQLTAIKDGLALAQKIEKDPDFIRKLKVTFSNLKQFIEVDSGYKNPALPYIVETPSLLRSGKRTGLDAGSLLGSLHSHNMEFGDYSDIPFDVTDDHLINTLSAMVADMKYRYPLNHNKIGFEKGVGVALGRYPEDIYDGYGTSEGNPWFISTASASEIIFKFLYDLKNRKLDIIINNQNKDFFQQFIDFDKIPSTDIVTVPANEYTDAIVIRYGSQTYKTLALNLASYSDSFLEIIKDHVDNHGRMSEQFNKYHGFMQGARDLTWSYSAVWNAFRWRQKTLDILDQF